jgi:hypothetical protein
MAERIGQCSFQTPEAVKAVKGMKTVLSHIKAHLWWAVGLFVLVGFLMNVPPLRGLHIIFWPIFYIVDSLTSHNVFTSNNAHECILRCTPKFRPEYKVHKPVKERTIYDWNEEAAQPGS